jgi:hypothetical protein
MNHKNTSQLDIGGILKLSKVLAACLIGSAIVICLCAALVYQYEKNRFVYGYRVGSNVIVRGKVLDNLYVADGNFKIRTEDGKVFLLDVSKKPELRFDLAKYDHFWDKEVPLNAPGFIKMTKDSADFSQGMSILAGILGKSGAPTGSNEYTKEQLVEKAALSHKAQSTIDTLLSEEVVSGLLTDGMPISCEIKVAPWGQFQLLSVDLNATFN